MIHPMTKCTRCGREFTVEGIQPVGTLILRVTSYPLRRPFGYLAAGFLVGGLVTIGSLLATSLGTMEDRYRATLIAPLIAFELILGVVLVRRLILRRSERGLCPNCRENLESRRFEPPEAHQPHKVALKKS